MNSQSSSEEAPTLTAPPEQRPYYGRLERSFSQKAVLLDDFLEHFSADTESLPDLAAFAARLVDGTAVLPIANPNLTGGERNDFPPSPAAVHLERKVIWEQSRLVTLCDYVNAHYDQLRYSFQRKVGAIGQAYEACKRAVSSHRVAAGHAPFMEEYIGIFDDWLQRGGSQSTAALSAEVLEPVQRLIKEHPDNPFAQTMARDCRMALGLRQQMAELITDVRASMVTLRDRYRAVARFAACVAFAEPTMNFLPTADASVAGGKEVEEAPVPDAQGEPELPRAQVLRETSDRFDTVTRPGRRWLPWLAIGALALAIFSVSLLSSARGSAPSAPALTTISAVTSPPVVDTVPATPITKVVTSVAASAGDPLDPVYGIDVSHHNGDIDWPAVLAGRRPRVRFLIAKATEGRGFVDPKFQDTWRQVGTSDLEGIAAYHFFTAADPVEQAEHFIRTVPRPPRYPPFLSGVGCGRKGHASACAQG